MPSKGLRVFDGGGNTSLNEEQNGRLDWDDFAGYEVKMSENRHHNFIYSVKISTPPLVVCD